MVNDQILVLLEQQSENFPELKSFIIAKGLKPSVLFLPQTLKNIAEEIGYKPTLILEAMDYLDVVKFYSTVLYSDPELFTNHICSMIVTNRTIDNINESLNKSALDDFMFSSKEDANAFLLNNKFLIAIYLFSLAVS
jgi:hypothetical protein